MGALSAKEERIDRLVTITAVKITREDANPRK
jgi:hypothetical protein